MHQQKISLNHILLLWLSLIAGYAQAQSQQVVIYQNIVSFSPSIQVASKGVNCIGLIYSADHIIMPSECAEAAKKAISGHAIDVLNRSGSVVGQLGMQEINSLLQLLKHPPATNMFIPYTPAETGTEASQELPSLFQTHSHKSSQFSPPFYLWSSKAGSSPSQWQEFQSIRATESGHYTLPLKDEQSRYIMGAPVIDSKGRVVCLMTSANKCQGLATNIGDDESCQMNCLKCTDYSWDSCTNGTGVGSCTNPDSGENCLVKVYRIGDPVEDSSATCTSSAGCGAVLCPSDCDSADSCDCVAGYGFDDDDLNIVDPDGCIDDLDNSGCDDLAGAGWALIGGMAVLGVTAVAITATIVGCVFYCKCRNRSSYKAIPGSQ